MKKNLLVISFLFLQLILFAQAKLSKSDMYKLDFNVLAQKKVLLERGDQTLRPAYRLLLATCEQLLESKAHSVMEKQDLPPSNNKHDYMSIAPYWWPDPSQKDGIPYLRKDGEINPETALYKDKIYLGELCEHVYMLSLGYYFSGDHRFAKKATSLMKTWFLDTATRMNPHLDFGQAVKGRFKGRAEGVIDTRHFIFMLDGVALLKNSTSWNASLEKGLKEWFAEFGNWMQSSEIGKEELNAGNNHGMWYDAQALAYSIFSGNDIQAKKVIERTLARLEKQMSVDGSFPLELERTTSLHYSVFILNAIQVIAQLSEQVGIDVWHHQLTNGKTLEEAYQFLLPYLRKEKEWKAGKQIKPFSYDNAIPLLKAANEKYHCKDCLQKINGELPPDELIHLL